MTRVTPCRLLIDPPGDGAWNMALDEALLYSAEDRGMPWLRLYQWAAPTLSLGYFQFHSDRQRHAASGTCPLVRRASGGGAILHHHELTYSIALPASHPAAKRPELLYDAAHQSLIETLGSWGIEARLHRAAEGSDRGGATEPFLCFQRRSPGDVVLGEYKICGSAQRRHRGAVLQHGSILLERSACAPELPGIRDLSPSFPCSADELGDAWRPNLAEQLRLELHAAAASEAITAEAARISGQKFGASSWTLRR